MAVRFPIARAKARFAECIRRAESGESIVLTRHGRPVARIAPIVQGHDTPAARPAGGAGSPASDQVREPEAAYDAPRRPPVARQSRSEALERLLREEIWPRVPADALGKGVEKREREAILGYGSDGL